MFKKISPCLFSNKNRKENDMTIWETNLAKKIPLKSSSVWKHLICSISQSVFETILFLILIREKTHGKKFWCQNIYTNLQKKIIFMFMRRNFITETPLLLCPIVLLFHCYFVQLFHCPAISTFHSSQFHCLFTFASLAKNWYDAILESLSPFSVTFQLVFFFCVFSFSSKL